MSIQYIDTSSDNLAKSKFSIKETLICVIIRAGSDYFTDKYVVFFDCLTIALFHRIIMRKYDP